MDEAEEARGGESSCDAQRPLLWQAEAASAALCPCSSLPVFGDKADWNADVSSGVIAIASSLVTESSVRRSRCSSACYTRVLRVGVRQRRCSPCSVCQCQRQLSMTESLSAVRCTPPSLGLVLSAG